MKQTCRLILSAAFSLILLFVNASSTFAQRFGVSGGWNVAVTNQQSNGGYLWPTYQLKPTLRVGILAGARFNSPIASGYDFSYIPLFATLTYHAPTTGKLKPFMGFGIGSITTRRTPQENVVFLQIQTETSLALNFHLGLNYEITKSFYVQVVTGSELSFVGYQSTYSQSNIPLLVGFGVKF